MLYCAICKFRYASSAKTCWQCSIAWGNAHRALTREATQAVGAGVLAGVGLRSLLRRGELVRVGDGLQLTDSGRRRAAACLHRLWEAYLVEHLGLPPDHVHDPAERMEHFIDSRLQEQIVADLSDAQRDPHGRDIPGG